MRAEIMISGSGGQGVVLSGAVLSHAFLFGGYEVASTYTYGPEARLGSSRSEVIVSDEPIDYPKISKPDYWVAMNQASLNTFSKRFDISKTILLADISNIKFMDMVRGRAKRVFEIPATDIAEKIGSRIAANMVMLGALVRISGLIKLEDLIKGIKEVVRKEFIEINVKAAEKGYEEIKI